MGFFRVVISRLTCREIDEDQTTEILSWIWNSNWWN